MLLDAGVKSSLRATYNDKYDGNDEENGNNSSCNVTNARLCGLYPLLSATISTVTVVIADISVRMFASR